MVDDIIEKAVKEIRNRAPLFAAGEIRKPERMKVELRVDRDDRGVLRRVTATVTLRGYAHSWRGVYDDGDQAREVFEGLVEKYRLRVVE
jgi:hypothetical protein